MNERRRRDAGQGTGVFRQGIQVRQGRRGFARATDSTIDRVNLFGQDTQRKTNKQTDRQEKKVYYPIQRERERSSRQTMIDPDYTARRMYDWNWDWTNNRKSEKQRQERGGLTTNIHNNCFDGMNPASVESAMGRPRQRDDDDEQADEQKGADADDGLGIELLNTEIYHAACYNISTAQPVQ